MHLYTTNPMYSVVELDKSSFNLNSLISQWGDKYEFQESHQESTEHKSTGSELSPHLVMLQ